MAHQDYLDILKRGVKDLGSAEFALFELCGFSFPRFPKHLQIVYGQAPDHLHRNGRPPRTTGL